MARDLSLPLRQAVITHLRADAGMLAELPAARIYGMRQQADTAWPFTRYGATDTIPQRAQCWDGQIVNLTLHVFSKGQFEDECAQISAAIVAALGDAVLTLGDVDATKAHFRWRSSQIVPDAAEAAAWHGIVRLEATLA
jgi:hypothetical protein